MSSALHTWLPRLRSLGPYLLIELLLPGGTLIALALWLTQHFKRGATSTHVEESTISQRKDAHPMPHPLRKVVLIACTLLPLSTSASEPANGKVARAAAAGEEVQRGKYLAKIAGCNDCHTPGYAMSGGKVPEKLWLTGDALGWRGPWGTTYAPNLRLYMNSMSEAQWVHRAKTMKTRPPMPWFALHDMTEQDLRALYKYVKVLGPAGEPAPAYVPPAQEPKGPYVQFPAPPK